MQLKQVSTGQAPFEPQDYVFFEVPDLGHRKVFRQLWNFSSPVIEALPLMTNWKNGKLDQKREIRETIIQKLLSQLKAAGKKPCFNIIR